MDVSFLFSRKHLAPLKHSSPHLSPKCQHELFSAHTHTHAHTGLPQRLMRTHAKSQRFYSFLQGVAYLSHADILNTAGRTGDESASRVNHDRADRGALSEPQLPPPEGGRQCRLHLCRGEGIQSAPNRHTYRHHTSAPGGLLPGHSASLTSSTDSQTSLTVFRTKASCRELSWPRVGQALRTTEKIL